MPSRKQSSIPESAGSIDTDNVEVASKTVMLESVVQNDDLCVECRDRMMPDDAAVTTDQYGNTRCVRRKNERFIPGVRHVRMDVRAIRHD